MKVLPGLGQPSVDFGTVVVPFLVDVVVVNHHGASEDRASQSGNADASLAATPARHRCGSPFLQEHPRVA